MVSGVHSDVTSPVGRSFPKAIYPNSIVGIGSGVGVGFCVGTGVGVALGKGVVLVSGVTSPVVAVGDGALTSEGPSAAEHAAQAIRAAIIRYFILFVRRDFR